jgi:hypothetical protein
MGTLGERHGHAEYRTITFEPLADADATPQQQYRAKCEPFGFVDGISQPVIKGTHKALRGADPNHLVEAGEFILGYPDNRGYIPPSPTLAAIHDPANLLPVMADPSPDFCNNIVNADTRRNRWFVDSPLEGSEFEPSVPKKPLRSQPLCRHGFENAATRDRRASPRSVR